MAITEARARELLQLAMERLAEVRNAIADGTALPEAAGTLPTILQHLGRWADESSALLDQAAVQSVLADIDAYKPLNAKSRGLRRQGPDDWPRFLHREEQATKRLRDKKKFIRDCESIASAIDRLLRKLSELANCPDTQHLAPSTDPATPTYFDLQLDENRREVTRIGHIHRVRFGEAEYHWVKMVYRSRGQGVDEEQIRNGYPCTKTSDAIRQAKHRAAEKLKRLGVTLSNDYPVEFEKYSGT